MLVAKGVLPGETLITTDNHTKEEGNPELIALMLYCERERGTSARQPYPIVWFGVAPNHMR